jgi:hypothetical protein
MIYSAAGVSISVFNSALAIIILATFIVLMLFEIRRIADLPPGSY